MRYSRLPVLVQVRWETDKAPDPMNNTNYEITEQEPTAEEFLALRSAVGWSNPLLQTAQSAISGSLFCVCVRHNGELVAFGRVVGDGSFIFYIQDMIVHPDHQKQGLGRAVMDRIMSYIEAAGGDDAYIGLMAARGASGFYERFGFSIREEEQPGMQRMPVFRQGGN